MKRKWRMKKESDILKNCKAVNTYDGCGIGDYPYLSLQITQVYVVSISAFHHTVKNCPETKSRQNSFWLVTQPRALGWASRHVHHLPSSSTDVLDPGKFPISSTRGYIGLKHKMLRNLLMKTLRVTCYNSELRQYKKIYKMLCLHYFEYPQKWKM